MFTGIVQAKVPVVAIDRNEFGLKLTVDRSNWSPDAGVEPKHGDSICVSGTCLTVIDNTPPRLTFDVIAETLAKTTLGDIKDGDLVNLEPAVTPNQPLGGHFMQGHVDGVGTIKKIQSGTDEWRITIESPTELMDSIIPKGSIAIDGVSLTLAAVHADSFEVALIPTTLELTTLSRRKVGDQVNLEADILAKTVVHFLRRQQGGRVQDVEATWDTLRGAGFMQRS